MKLISKTAACLCAVMIAASSAAAVGVCAADSTAPLTSAAKTADARAKTEATTIKYGKVTAINGSEITVSLGEFAAKTKTSADGTSTKDKSAVKKGTKKKKTSSDTKKTSTRKGSTKTDGQTLET